MSERSRRFERDAVQSFCVALAAQTGVTVEVVNNPEDDPVSLVTVDALLRVDDEIWAVEHVRLAQEPTVVPANRQAQIVLGSRLDGLAVSYQQCLVVSCFPPRRAGYTPAEIRGYYNKVVEMAEHSLKSGKAQFDNDGVTSVQVLPSNALPSGPRAQLSLWEGLNPSIEAQVVAGLDAALRSKLSRQLARAKAAGFRIMLLIDQVGEPGSKQPPVWLASDGTVKMVVDRLVDEFPEVIDSVWFRKTDGTFTKLRLSAE